MRRTSGEAEGLEDAGKAAPQVSANAPLMPEPQWSRVIDDAKGRDGSHEKHAAHDQKNARSTRLRHLQDHQRITRRKQHGSCQRQHADSRQQAGHVLGPASGGVIVSKQLEPITNQPSYDNEISDNCDPRFYVHDLTSMISAVFVSAIYILDFCVSYLLLDALRAAGVVELTFAEHKLNQ
jgi:hypothetical protein